MSEAPSGWQPIATAPKDGTQLLLCIDYDAVIVVGSWRTDDGGRWAVCWDHVSIDDATHWMPLPSAATVIEAARVYWEGGDG